MLHANFVVVCFSRTGVIAEGSFTLWEYDDNVFGPCDLDLDPMTLIYEFNRIPSFPWRHTVPDNNNNNNNTLTFKAP